MAHLKKNAMNQIMFVLTDKTDFVSIESGITSNITVKFFGVNHGGSTAMASGTVSKTASVVHSGIFRQTLKAAETNYDYVTYMITHASAAEQVLAFQTVDNDDSDIMSAIAIGNSRALLCQSLASDAHSAAAKSYSQVILAASQISDVYSLLGSASLYSDIASAVWGHADGASLVARVLTIKSTVSDAHSAAAKSYSQVILAASVISDIDSALNSQYTILSSRINKPVATASRLLLAESVISDAHSAAAKAYSQVILAASAISDIDSAITSRFSDLHSFMSTTGVGLNASTMSDLRSAVAAGPAATVTDSDISNIASAVWAQHYNAHSLASSFGSLFEKMASGISDAYSMAVANSGLISNVYSLTSDIYSAINVTATASDVASAVWAQHYNTHSLASSFGSMFEVMASRVSDVQSALTVVQSMASDAHSAAAQANSRALVIQSIASDAHSAAILGASHASDAYSAALLTQSLISDVQSQLLVVQSMASDAHSAAAQANSRALVAQSFLSDIDSALTSQYGAVSNYLSTMNSNVTSMLAIAQSAASDAASGATVLQSKVLVMQSWLSDLDSALTSRFSDIHSFMSTTGVGLNASMMSDLRSAITAGPAAADATSIASAVWAHAKATSVTSGINELQSRVTGPVATSAYLSDVASALSNQISGITATVDNASVASAVWAHAIAASLVSRVSDVQSALDSQYTKVYSAVAAGGLNASAISDIASAVWGQKFKGASAHNVGSTFGSAFALATSRISDIDSGMNSQYTKVYSAVNRNGSQLSLVKSLASDAHSAAILAASHASDAYSAALLTQSMVSDMDSALTSRFSDTLSLLRSVFASTLSDIDSAVSSQYTHILSRVTTTGVGLNASALSDVGSVVDARLDTAFTDATALNANGLKDRLRTAGWILRNKMVVTSAGAGQLLKDDDATEAFSVANQLTSDATSVVRKRWA